MTKSNLQIAGSSFDDYDCNLIVMYTSYLYRKRVGDDPVMPRMLRYALNNRVFAEKANAKEGGESS